MKPRKHIKSKDELFKGVEVGKAMSHRCGSDSYGYWIAEVDKANGIIGVYTPEAHFEKSWADGSMVPAAFSPCTAPDKYYKASRGKWRRFNIDSQTLGECVTLYPTDTPCIYRDPSF